MGLCVETKEELRMTSVNVVTRHTNYLLMFLICDYKDGRMFSFMKIDIWIAVNDVTQYTNYVLPSFSSSSVA